MESPDSDPPRASGEANAGTRDAPSASIHLRRALFAGAVAGVPAAWLLAYLAPMPYLLGLFFFLLVGLIVGAVMCRAARSGAPIPRRRSTHVSLAVSLLVWSGVLVMEYRWFPEMAARKAVRLSLVAGMGDAGVQAYRERVRHAAREQLKTGYWPGRLPGYVRWAVTSGRMELPRAGSDEPVQIQNVQLPLGWVLRVAASLALLMFAIDSQMASLAPKPFPEEDSGGKDEQPAAD